MAASPLPAVLPIRAGMTNHSAVALRIGEDAIGRLHFIERIHEEWGDLVPGDL
ncbi:hypothetical protein [Ancylobacter lacus]|uniref:hypothetical protein n=1 Tax=Ancylobacter lacus TaxID=2579970 RepID=UPI001BCB70AC|nr:hypothetical protein [Ancylobacter lacus]MBS7537351.1 hypothetical protein [Ancylobacter lacus]